MNLIDRNESNLYKCLTTESNTGTTKQKKINIISLNQHCLCTSDKIKTESIYLLYIDVSSLSFIDDGVKCRQITPDFQHFSCFSFENIIVIASLVWLTIVTTGRIFPSRFPSKYITNESDTGGLANGARVLKMLRIFKIFVCFSSVFLLQSTTIDYDHSNFFLQNFRANDDVSNFVLL